MTYIQYINCDKWKMVIAITLWSGATIGLGMALYEVISALPTHTYDRCEDKLDKNFVWQSTCSEDYGVAFVIIGITTFGNIVNYYFIWKVLNDKHKWLEIRCGVKPKTDQVK